MPDYTGYTHEQLVQEINKKETSRKKLKASLVLTSAKDLSMSSVAVAYMSLYVCCCSWRFMM